MTSVLITAHAVQAQLVVPLNATLMSETSAFQRRSAAETISTQFVQSQFKNNKKFAIVCYRHI